MRQDYISFIDTQMLDKRAIELYNGVGSNLWYLSWVNSYIPEDIVELFEPAAIWHDVAYSLGGTDEQRMWADTHFEQLIMDACYTLQGYARIRARFWARVCFVGVRTGGTISWEKREAPVSIQELFA